MIKSYKELIKDYKINTYLDPSSISRKILSYFKLIIILALILMLFARWVPIVKGQGRVIAFDPNMRRQMIESPIEGRIKKWHVNEGDKVKKGNPIVTIVALDPQRLERIQSKKNTIEDKISTLNENKRISQIHVERIKKLLKYGAESKRELELAEIDLLKVNNQINQLELTKLEIDSELSKQESQEVLAQFDGTIMQILAQEQNSFISLGEKLAKIIPSNNQLAVELVIKGKDLALIKELQKVRLVFDGWPAVQVAGWPSIAVGTFEGQIKIIDAGDDGQGNFRIIVLPNGNPSWPEDLLRMGTKAEGWIQLKRVPVWWEIWRLISGVPPIV